MPFGHSCQDMSKLGIISLTCKSNPFFKIFLRILLLTSKEVLFLFVLFPYIALSLFNLFPSWNMEHHWTRLKAGKGETFKWINFFYHLPYVKDVGSKYFPGIQYFVVRQCIVYLLVLFSLFLNGIDSQKWTSSFTQFKLQFHLEASGIVTVTIWPAHILSTGKLWRSNNWLCLEVGLLQRAS